ncbi:ankyrin repeat domain-containing protein [Candidatus Poribacteria bacterium]|nr:ankyrin repeat domain-containing protein [Candidatus Poribacteria bacterium]MBT5710193.1 ankyrin repeat domain-containing protein [Candidatus Poribacteria bacterium]MBT7096260.1 ankyrin repeat domain-containing protein [Candidatus Poribacteria bacterium]MBT7804447.1 ankyrin repeat domain-containing protein [Candidatus Poribacteria bacterium]
MRGGVPSRDTALVDRVARLVQPQSMKTPDYQNGVEKVDGNDAWDLMKACAEGDIEEVRRLLTKDARLVNAQQYYQFPIHFAVREGHSEVVALLLDNGAEPGQSRYMYNSWQKLVPEAKRRGYDVILGLLESTLRERYGYDPDFEPLAQAIRDRDRCNIEAILAERPDLACAADVRGGNALHWAAHTQQIELVDYFLERGADIDGKRADGQTPAMMAINGDYWQPRKLPEGVTDNPGTVLRYLLEKGAGYDLSVAIHLRDVPRVRELLGANPGLATQLDSSQRSYLFDTARTGQLDIAELLLELGADPSASETLAPQGCALHEAAARDHLEMVRVLLEHGADPNGNVDSSGDAMFISVWDHPDGPEGVAVRSLLSEYGAETPPYDRTVEELKQALETSDDSVYDEQFVSSVFDQRDAELFRLLMSKHADATRLLPFVGSRYPGSSECIEIMFELGADANASNWMGKTWLHFAADRNDIDAARVLLEHGADINAVEAEHGSTPLAEAAKKGHVEMVSFLMERGADPNVQPELWARSATFCPFPGLPCSTRGCRMVGVPLLSNTH